MTLRRMNKETGECREFAFKGKFINFVRRLMALDTSGRFIYNGDGWIDTKCGGIMLHDNTSRLDRFEDDEYLYIPLKED